MSEENKFCVCGFAMPSLRARNVFERLLVRKKLASLRQVKVQIIRRKSKKQILSAITLDDLLHFKNCGEQTAQEIWSVLHGN